MTPVFAPGDRVIYASDEFGNLAATVGDHISFGRGGFITAYRIETIHGPMIAFARKLAPAGNVTVLRPTMDTLPSEMDVLP